MTNTTEFHLFRLTWPIFLELALFMLLGISDTFMLSAISDNAVAGVGAANQFLQIAILILSVIGNGAAIVVAQYLGSRKLRDAAKIASTAVSLNLAVGIVISIAFLLLNGVLLRSLNLSGEVYAYAQRYLVIVGGALFVQALINSMAALIRMHGFTKGSMFISLGMNVLHVLLNYLLIFGHGGLPRLGVEGAAVSTVISRSLALLVFMWMLYRVMEIKPKLVYFIQLSQERIAQILKIGLPSAFEQITYQSCQMIFLFYVTYLGEQSLAARQYASNISMFIYLFATAIGMGTSIIVGRLVGGRKTDQAYRQVWTSLRWASAATLVMVIVVITLRYPLMGIFTDNPEVIRFGAQLLLLSFFLETGRTMNIILINSLRATGDARYPVWIGLFSMLGMSVPLGYLLVFVLDLGVAGVWLAIASDEWLRAVIMYFRWKSRKWERHAITPVSAPDAGLNPEPEPA